MEKNISAYEQEVTPDEIAYCYDVVETAYGSMTMKQYHDLKEYHERSEMTSDCHDLIMWASKSKFSSSVEHLD